MLLTHHRLTTPLKSERGQMAIFIALIFQVLFVFFAMIVNVGLIVHDKINLQNSVDLAAYYAAQRQAEMLNVIAHENYQIRQAWKLLAWRLRVLGDLGYKEHPMISGGNNFQDDDAYRGGVTAGGSRLSNWRPTVCINHGLWGAKGQSLCHTSSITIPDLPVTKTINIFLPSNFLTTELTKKLRDMANVDCQKTGPVNFNMAVRWVQAYRHQIAQSKEIIRQYADELSKEPGDFRDIKKDSAKMGTLKTLTRNLTRANFKSLEENGFRMFNSLGSMGGRNSWLNEVPIYPTIFYTDMIEGGGCRAESKQINGAGKDNRPAHDPNPNNEDDMFRNEPPRVTDITHSVFGVEKNPWAMAYIGVYAETKPRKPYLPFGEPIVLRAKAFAKPFGGRIGPWYYRKWPQGSPRSAGISTDKVDKLMPMPLNVDGTLETTSDGEKELSVPNYSRYPGDEWGLRSKAALALFKDTLTRSVEQGNSLSPGFYSGTPSSYDGLAMAAKEFSTLNGGLKSLKYNGPWVRELEVAAIAPDLFDATYYSVEVNFLENYIAKGIAGNYFNEQTAPLDIGSMTFQNARTIKDQIDVANQMAAKNSNMNFYLIKDPVHLLTAWAPSSAYKYDFPTEAFGKCQSGDLKVPVPGMCAQGGRVGYSVKIVSEEYLNSENLPLGGEGITGKLINPPPKSF